MKKTLPEIEDSVFEKPMEQLLNIAVNFAVEIQDRTNLRQLLKYCSQNCQMIIVSRESLRVAVNNKNLKLMHMLLRYEVRLGRASNLGFSQITPSDFIQIVYESQGTDCDQQLIIKLTSEFENQMEYDKLGFLIMRYQSLNYATAGEIIDLLFDSKSIDIRNKQKIVLESLVSSIQLKRFDISIRIYNRYAIYFPKFPRRVIAALVSAFEEEPCLVDFKLFLFLKFLPYFRLPDLDRTILALSNQILPQGDKAMNPMDHNLNPIKSVMHFFAIIDKIEQQGGGIYKIRTQSIKDELTRLAENYLNS